MAAYRLRPIKVPEIRFSNGWLLTNAFFAYRQLIPKFKKDKPPTRAEMDKIVRGRTRIWKKDEKKIIVGMQKIAGLNFYQNLIDVYLVAGYRSAFSTPLVMNRKYDGELFIDVLTHEILHRLLTDNTQGRTGRWPAKAYPKIKDQKTLNHILVHAIHKEIYLKILKRPDRLQMDIDRCKEWPSYKRAWEIVEKEGHLNIIDKFRKSRHK